MLDQLPLKSQSGKKELRGGVKKSRSSLGLE